MTVVEWGHGLAEDLADDRLEVALSGEDTRRAAVQTHGARWAGADLTRAGGSRHEVASSWPSTPPPRRSPSRCMATDRVGLRRSSTRAATPSTSRPLIDAAWPAAGRHPGRRHRRGRGNGPGPFTGLRVGIVTGLSSPTPAASPCTASAASTPWRSKPPSTSARASSSSPPTRDARRSTGRATASTDRPEQDRHVRLTEPAVARPADLPEEVASLPTAGRGPVLYPRALPAPGRRPRRPGGSLAGVALQRLDARRADAGGAALPATARRPHDGGTGQVVTTTCGTCTGPTSTTSSRSRASSSPTTPGRRRPVGRARCPSPPLLRRRGGRRGRGRRLCRRRPRR